LVKINRIHLKTLVWVLILAFGVAMMVATAMAGDDGGGGSGNVAIHITHTVRTIHTIHHLLQTLFA
jgi:ABC-type methionine transport system permease subunit